MGAASSHSCMSAKVIPPIRIPQTPIPFKNENIIGRIGLQYIVRDDTYSSTRK
jgi:hypothetical protein